MYFGTKTNTYKPEVEIAGNDSDDKIIFPKISVIIPVYMEEKLIGNTLSAFTNELKKQFNLEVIVSDGGSTDNTLEIARDNADVIVPHTAPGRQTISQGRNRGADKATGDILMFLNGDCTIKEPQKFFSAVRDWVTNNDIIPECDAIACKVSINPVEVLMKDRIFYFIHNNYVRLLNFMGFGMGRGECQIVKRRVFESIGGYNERLAAGEDFDLYRRISKIGETRFTNKLIVYESPRRFRKYGYIKILWSWTLNSLSVIFRGKSVSDEWEAVR